MTFRHGDVVTEISDIYYSATFNFGNSIILSMGILDTKGCKLEICLGKVTLFDADGSPFAKGSRMVNNLYQLNLCTLNPPMEPTDLPSPDPVLITPAGEEPPVVTLITTRSTARANAHASAPSGILEKRHTS